MIPHAAGMDGIQRTPPFCGSWLPWLACTGISGRGAPAVRLPLPLPRYRRIAGRGIGCVHADRSPLPEGGAGGWSDDGKGTRLSEEDKVPSPDGVGVVPEPETVRRRPKWLAPVAAGCVLALLAVGGVAGCRMWSARELCYRQHSML